MNCVLTTATENILIGVERFLKSYRQTNQIDDVVVFMREPTNQNKNECKRLGDLYKTKFIYYNASFCSSIAELMSKRFIFYDQYLNDATKNILYEKIFLTDCTDVIFQRNIFDFVFNEDLIFFEEKSIIKNEPINLGWIKCFSENIVNSLLEKPVLCMGTILGTQKGANQFIKQFIDIMFTNNKSIPLNFDQAVMNIMVHMNKITNATYRTINNENGPVGTIGLSAALKKLNIEEMCVDENDRVIPVVHQFNRMSDDLKIRLCKARDLLYGDLI